jgi:D-alanyl-D-alanine carboxypeptidase (penicillin-binding protein 5/6)
MRAIAVVMGAPTSKERNAQVTKLLDYAFSQYTTKKLYKKDQVIAKLEVSRGKKQAVNLVASDNVSLLLKRGENAAKVTEDIVMEEQVKAPIKKGSVLGTLVIKAGNKVIAKEPLVANEDITEAGLWELFKRTISLFSKSQ